MGQKVNPKGFRIGVYRDWDARWFARKSYGKQIIEDVKLRRFLNRYLDNAEVARVEIEKAGDDSVKVIIHSGRPGVIIGKGGQDIETLKKDISNFLKRPNVEISVQEVKSPELDATLVAKNIAAQLEKRGSFKSAMKKAVASAMRAGAKGIKVRCAGRLGGAEIAREEYERFGQLPLHTLRSDIDYGFAEAKTTYGIIGVKAWICKGEVQQ
ncbi:MAG TPA: 30S ribosomal protein S3 [Candidatus Babeliales bacterium]|nr:30S ribosomal protein S3 [Candidatus Dependentiae bacterium]HEX2977792.1 30S ribosomal protein S3 [Candidatus Babeliales bacterium]